MTEMCIEQKNSHFKNSIQMKEGFHGKETLQLGQKCCIQMNDMLT